MSTFTNTGGKLELTDVKTTVKLNRWNMESWLRETRSTLATKFPKKILSFMTPDIAWKPKPVTRDDFMVETEELAFDR